MDGCTAGAVPLEGYGDMAAEKQKDADSAVGTTAPRRRRILPLAIGGAVLVLAGSAGAYVALAPMGASRQTIFAYDCRIKEDRMACAPFSIVDQ